MANEKWSQQPTTNLNSTTMLCTIDGVSPNYTNNLTPASQLWKTPIFNGDTIVDGDLNVTGITNLNDQLIVSGNIEDSVTNIFDSNSEWSVTGSITGAYSVGWSCGLNYTISSTTALSTGNTMISILILGDQISGDIKVYAGSTLIGTHLSDRDSTYFFPTLGNSGILSIVGTSASVSNLKVSVQLIMPYNDPLLSIKDSVLDSEIFGIRSQKNTGNLFFGPNCGENFKYGYNNIGIGNASDDSFFYGSNNILIGGSSIRTKKNNSIIIGIGSVGSANDNTNEIVIGTNCSGKGSYSAILGSPTITGTTLQGNVMPYYNGTKNLGSANYQWNNIYSVNSPIVSSDERIKTSISGFTQNEINASIQLSKEIGIYKFLTAIQEKGDAARKHIGFTVQKAIEILKNNNLNPFEYSFICYDEWAEEIINHPAIDNVDSWIETKPAGNLYSFRYTELLMFMSLGFEERLTLIENK